VFKSVPCVPWNTLSNAFAGSLKSMRKLYSLQEFYLVRHAAIDQSEKNIDSN